jgi:hypothetical protein
MQHPRLDFESEATEATAVRGIILAVLLLLCANAGALAQQSGSPSQGNDSQPGVDGNSTASPDQSQSPDQSDDSLPAAGVGLSAYETQAQKVLKKLTARQFDRRLPQAGLQGWFAGQIGKRAQIDWTTAECGDEGGEPDTTQGSDSGPGANLGQPSNGIPGNNADVTLCTEGQALFYGADGKPSLDRYVVLQLLVGTRRLGVDQNPGAYGPDAMSVFVFDGNTTRTLSRLGDLPPVLATMN